MRNFLKSIFLCVLMGFLATLILSLILSFVAPKVIGFWYMFAGSSLWLCGNIPKSLCDSLNSRVSRNIVSFLGCSAIVFGGIITAIGLNVYVPLQAMFGAALIVCGFIRMKPLQKPSLKSYTD